MTLFALSNIEVVRLSQWLNWAGGEDRSELLVLPMIQRGSVWKPEQIINLWDTLLRGMPIGSFMVSAVPEGTSFLHFGKNNKTAEKLVESGFALLDGQQRTLSMLIAWPTLEPIDRKLWIDFADEPGVGQIFRLRVTTESQKFGYQRLAPSTKLSLDDRRKAMDAYEAEYGEGKVPDFEKTHPYINDHSLPVELRTLIELWNNHQNRDLWSKEVVKKLGEIIKCKSVYRDASGKLVCEKYCVWGEIEKDNGKLERALRYVELLASALDNLFFLDVPIIKVGDEIFKDNDDNEKNNLEPPLAILFQRIGGGGTPLSNADYAYSVIKHRYPDTYEFVESLHNTGRIATTLSATDLVMTALRLAVAKHPWGKAREVADASNPDKRLFHTMLTRGADDFIKTSFLPLITEGHLKKSFEALEDVLNYQKESNQNGLPVLAFPLLGRPLMQILLRWVQLSIKAGKESELIPASNMEILRFVLFWVMWVKDANKASEIAFHELKEGDVGIFPAETIYKRLIERGVAYALVAPTKLENIPELLHSPENVGKPMRGWNGRFFVDGETEEHQKARKFYARWWNKSGDHHIHPVLLWLQREYIADNFDEVMLAGREDETPYDYDHICPSSHWHGWTGVSKDASNRLLDFCRDNDAHWRVGNSIGNLRVWDGVRNRSDGDASPAVKLKPKDTAQSESSQPTQAQLLKWSSISEDEKGLWEACSRDGDDKKVWDTGRASAFQQAVERRAFHLYERYFKELGFDEWVADAEENNHATQH